MTRLCTYSLKSNYLLAEVRQDNLMRIVKLKTDVMKTQDSNYICLDRSLYLAFTEAPHNIESSRMKEEIKK